MNTALVCGPKGSPVYAISLPGKNNSETDSPSLRWDSKSTPFVTSDVPTPLFYRDRFYILSDVKKNLSCVDPRSGDLVWQIILPGKYKWRSSPTAGDGKVFLMNHNAKVLVVNAHDGTVLNEVQMLSLIHI